MPAAVALQTSVSTRHRWHIRFQRNPRHRAVEEGARKMTGWSVRCRLRRSCIRHHHHHPPVHRTLPCHPILRLRRPPLSLPLASRAAMAPLGLHSVRRNMEELRFRHHSKRRSNSLSCLPRLISHLELRRHRPCLGNPLRHHSTTATPIRRLLGSRRRLLPQRRPAATISNRTSNLPTVPGLLHHPVLW
jgi:hypothetical protein